METSEPQRRSCRCRTGAEHQAAIAAIRDARLANDKETKRLKTIEEYAIDLVVSGAESTAEDDLNEDGEVAEDDHEAACDLAIDIAHAIRDNPQAVLQLAAPGKAQPTPAELMRLAAAEVRGDQCDPDEAAFAALLEAGAQAVETPDPVLNRVVVAKLAAFAVALADTLDLDEEATNA